MASGVDGRQGQVGKGKISHGHPTGGGHARNHEITALMAATCLGTDTDHTGLP